MNEELRYPLHPESRKECLLRTGFLLNGKIREGISSCGFMCRDMEKMKTWNAPKAEKI
jgi:hypothetical protein